MLPLFPIDKTVNSLAFYDPAAFNTCCAGFDFFASAVDYRTHALEIRLEHMLCTLNRVTDSVSNGGLFTAYIALPGHYRLPCCFQYECNI